MNLLDILRWLRDEFGTDRTDAAGDDDADVPAVDPERAADLATSATGDGVSKSLLLDPDRRFTRNPPVTYLEAGEQPEYALTGGRVWFGEEPSMQGDEVPTRRTLILVTDDRILILVGGRIKDTAWGVPHGDIEHTTIRYADREAYFFLDIADEENAESTLVELLVDSDPAYFSEVVEYCNERGTDGSATGTGAPSA